MSTDNSNLSIMDPAYKIDELEDDVLGIDDELEEEVPLHDRTAEDVTEDLRQGTLAVPKTKRDGAKPPTKAQLAKQEAADAAEAERMALQPRVPWKLIPGNSSYSTDYEQKREIDQWADDWGHYPRIYRSYTREEWTQAINLLAETVAGLATSHPDYQRTTGLYVEERTDDLLLIRAKKWQLVIQIPAKSSVAGKKFELKVGLGNPYWGGQDDRATQFAELLSMAPRESRDVLLDICCQYLRDVRIRVNKQAWADQNNDIAYLIKGSR